MAYIGKQPVIGNFQKCDAISVVNGQAAYTLQVGGSNVFPQSENHMLVSLNGILQAPTDSFTVSGSTITFASALSTGDVIDFVMILGNVLDLGVPSDNTVTTAKLADSSVTTSKLNDSSVSLAKLTATGTKDATTFLRGDNTFAEVPAGGITEADQWRLTASFTGSGDLTSNLERIDTNSPGLIGTGMSESSGIFTFPSTGVYLITAVFASYLNGSNRAHNGSIQVTTNNSSYTGASSNYTNQFNFGNTVYANSKTEFLFDVTSTSTHKVKFSISTDNASSTTYGGTTENGTCFSFIRLGDT